MARACLYGILTLRRRDEPLFAAERLASKKSSRGLRASG